MLPTNFRAKLMTLHSGQNSSIVGPRGIFVQNFPDVFFLFSKDFSICFLDLYAINKFSCKNANIGFGPKFLISQT